MTHWAWDSRTELGLAGAVWRSVYVDCSKTTNRIQPWFGELSSQSAGWGWVVQRVSPLATSEGDRRAHRGETGGAKGLHDPIDLESGEGQDRVLIDQWVSQVYSHIFVPKFYFLMKR